MVNISIVIQTKFAKIVLYGSLDFQALQLKAKGLFYFFIFFYKKEGFLKDLSNYLVRINLHSKKIFGVEKC